MPFENLEFDVPDGLATDEFVLRPIVAADAELDYAAVMESRVYPRSWEPSSWPEHDYGAAVYFWVRKSRLATRTDRVLLDALRAWLARDWGLAGHLIVTNEQFTQQVDMIEHAGLQLRFEVEEPDKPGRYLAYS